MPAPKQCFYYIWRHFDVVGTPNIYILQNKTRVYIQIFTKKPEFGRQFRGKVAILRARAKLLKVVCWENVARFLPEHFAPRPCLPPPDEKSWLCMSRTVCMRDASPVDATTLCAKYYSTSWPDTAMCILEIYTEFSRCFKVVQKLVDVLKRSQSCQSGLCFLELLTDASISCPSALNHHGCSLSYIDAQYGTIQAKHPMYVSYVYCQSNLETSPSGVFSVAHVAFI